MLIRSLCFAVLVGVVLGVNATAVAGADDARVRVLHASPDAPAVDVWLDGSPVEVLTNVPFGVISGYLVVPAGDHEIKVVVSGTTSSVIEANVNLEAGRSYTIAAIGPASSIGPRIIVDDPDPASDKTKVRVVHLSPDAPPVDVAQDEASPDDAVVRNLAYPDATSYVALPPGSYDLEIRPTGTTDVALQLDPLQLQAGRAYSVFAIGSAATEPLGGNALRVLVVVDAVAAPATDTAGDSIAASTRWAMMAILVVFALAAGIATAVLHRRPDSRRRI